MNLKNRLKKLEQMNNPEKMSLVMIKFNAENRFIQLRSSYRNVR